MRKRRVERAVVSITRDPMEGQAVCRAIEMLPLKEIFKTGDTVVITPNWVNTRAPQTGTVVGPETLRELIKFIKGQNPGRLVVACGSGGAPTPQVLEQTGYKEVLQQEQAEFVDTNYGPYVELELNHPYPPSTPINKLIMEADVLISFTQIKQHEEATVSLGIKNIALSWPPAEIHGWPKTQRGIHERLHGFIAAMAEKIPIDLTILSGNKGMIGTGPSKGKPVDSDIVIAGTDPVATDVVGARLLGFMPQAVQYLYDLALRGVGEGDLKKVQLKGVPLYEAEEAFSSAAYGHPVVVDQGRLKPFQLK
ncbi:protein of unknown function DUF362 [Desulforamulus reducens MI-1]|uniref:DUF362 domain-containing protein n=1 Tax=Desulforamulus reducens (strain ATCC BAA-1160 / DSM 100696 / MI-1) TaxID=349161 RepID=A4J439_DESRM|nr:DUF362 domain-containing protein [Desulforamulus reducens]ABO49842.1 protein of unknown function DUF362 [Desulforamulus reducens MI-1]